MIGYRFLPPADEEMTEASLFYEAASTGLGNDFLDDVQRAVQSLREHPNLGHAVDRNLRQMLLHRFPFSLVYPVEADAIFDCCSRSSRSSSGVLASTSWLNSGRHSLSNQAPS